MLVVAAELAAAGAADPPHARGDVREDFEQPGLDWRVLDGELDVYDDGTIRLLPTPGHPAGHTSLLLELDGPGGPAHRRCGRQPRPVGGTVPPRALSSREDAEQSLQRLRELALETGALIVFGHDPENWAGLRHAPDNYS